MLEEGLIEHNTSPFSSLVLLVTKKKKKRWNVAILYQLHNLNAITVKDTFSIPIVDELLDKLYDNS